MGETFTGCDDKCWLPSSTDSFGDMLVVFFDTSGKPDCLWVQSDKMVRILNCCDEKQLKVQSAGGEGNIWWWEMRWWWELPIVTKEKVCGWGFVVVGQGIKVGGWDNDENFQMWRTRNGKLQSAGVEDCGL